MTKNQKIALGCGGLGCLGLIVVILTCAVVWYTYQKRSAPPGDTNRNYNFNSNTNRSLQSNSNSSTSPSTSLSEDDRHKLFQAAATSGDHELMSRVMEKLGLNQTKAEANEQFMKDHLVWVFKNSAFLKEIDSQEKAKAYVNEHIND